MAGKEKLNPQQLNSFVAESRCQRCGKCCQEGLGIALLKEDTRRLKEILPFKIKQSWSKFKENTFTFNGYRLIKFPCALFNPLDKICLIYSSRPSACRLFPLSFQGDITFVSMMCPEAQRLIEKEGELCKK